MKGANATNPCVAGIDGCRGGWMSMTLANGEWSYAFEPHLDELISIIQAQLIFIDIPIGLTSKSFIRSVDTFARKELSPHKSSSVFTPPCREALQAEDYRQTLEYNRRVTGKGISIQSWNITPKILEADKLLEQRPQLRQVIYEAHPEICFKYLNRGHVLRSTKKSTEGIAERLAIIKAADKAILPAITSALKGTLRREVAHDDIIDASVLAIAALKAHANGIHLVNDMETVDDAEIPVRIAYGVDLDVGTE